MPFTQRERDNFCDWLVIDVLRVKPDAIKRDARRFTAERPLEGQLVERFRIRAAMSGWWTGMRKDLGASLLAGTFEHIEWLRRSALVRASLAYHEDPQFFEREDWTRTVLALRAGDDELETLAVRALARIGLRTAAIRAVRHIPRLFGERVGRFGAPIVGVSVAGALGVMELERLCARHRSPHVADVLTLPLRGAQRTA